MIEVIYKEDKEDQGTVQEPFSMPRNVRQIGLANGDYRIYIEDYVYTFLKKTAEKKEAVEIARREFLANGGIYNKRPDFDVVKLFEYDMDKNIQNIKNNECKYD